jgi:glycosyltransferase involved in cell wall biosynthesis
MTAAMPFRISALSAEAQVTIGMPILDNARTLQRAIESVQAQSFGGWRLIISDDGSSDGGDRIAEAAAAKDHRISLVRQPRRLGVMNFRVPLDRAETPYFAWLAGDDHWHPDFLAETLRALNAAPAAISALPQAVFVGPTSRPVPNLGFLKGNARGRIQSYLAHPGGTRMYGLMRTTEAKAAFPPRPFHAYDWYLMVALLAKGPQLSLPQTLIFREETPWWRYATAFAEETPSGLRRSFPILEMSWQLIRDRKVPLGALPALVGLNLRKHEEVLALTRPETWHRRRWLYRSLALPISSSSTRKPGLTIRHTKDGGRELAAFAHPIGAETRVTAILTFRNAAQTLAQALDHLQTLGCKIIAIDHGSTDGSRAIAEARRGASVQDVVGEAWTGTFDLTRQLALKRGIIAALPPGWVLHADADEFLDPPEGQSLTDCLARADAGGHVAFNCDEHLFVPGFEDEEHDPQTFPQTMTAYVRMRERDRKQRLFRSDADLGLWLRTGGHTVTRDPRRIADVTLTLRHYPGLSLDDLRSQYLSRVFSPEDRARLWHGNRMAAGRIDIVEPERHLFSGTEPVELDHLPFFAQRSPDAARPLPPESDLYLLGEDALDAPEHLILSALPGLRTARIAVADLGGMTRMVPVLHILSHPAGLHGPGIQRSIERSRAIAWTRRIALARQWAADRGAIYAEVRAEDTGAQPDLLKDQLVRLWHKPVLRGTDGFLDPRSAPIRQGHWANPVRRITGPLAADLGYR